MKMTSRSFNGVKLQAWKFEKPKHDSNLCAIITLRRGCGATTTTRGKEKGGELD
jgi:hypothetical protein